MDFKQYIYRLIISLTFILIISEKINCQIQNNGTDNIVSENMVITSEKITSQIQNNSIEYIIIGNNIGTQKLSSKNLKNIFNGEKTFWGNKNKIILTLPSSKNPLCSIISKNIYNMSVMGMQKYWLSLTFQGNITPPVFLENDEETIKFIENNPGSIGFILETNLNKTKAQKISIEN